MKSPAKDTLLLKLPSIEHNSLLSTLQIFTTRHQSHHRPIALVTSGGTAADLEVNAVRFLDNFSTGLRGAISVEEFLKRGYAVIHLWRKGSAAPYTRVLNRLLSSSGKHEAGLDFETISRLFEGQEVRDDINCDDSGRCTNQDPWLTSPPSSKSSLVKNEIHDDRLNEISGEAKLSKHILNSTILKTKLRERMHVVQKGLLLTLPFRTVGEYLVKLQLCAQAIRDCQSLGLIYSAAAVSDFYIPAELKSEHKIQSRDYGGVGAENSDGDGKETDGDKGEEESSIQVRKSGEGITIHLSPVPKCISFLREEWAPDAFCVTFKLETDKTILYEKAKMAIDKYGVHIVIGNLLSTRHEKVCVLQRKDDENSNDSNDLPVVVISKESHTKLDSDELEDQIISFIVEKHFSYIANHCPTSKSEDNLPTTVLMASAEAAACHNLYLREKKKKLQKELYWKKVQDMTLQLIGHAAGMYLTYIFSTFMQKRLR